MIIIFLGYGLVNVPKHCLLRASIPQKYEFAMFKVSQQEEYKENAKL